jgi:alpha-ketoglutarate-dependent taurine dioxygenase
MSSLVVDSNPSTGVVEVTADLGWASGPDVVGQVLAEHFQAELDAGLRTEGIEGSVLPAPVDPARLRARLRDAVPGLAELADRIQATFDGPAARACAVVVPRLGLAGLEVERQRQSVFGLATVLGDVTPTDPVDRRVVWDVRNEGANSRHSSFSQNDREAEYHSDSAMLPRPERYFLLYAVKQANCGGGVSFLRDIRQLTDELAGTERGRAVLRVLGETPLPMRVPKAFRPHFAEVSSYRDGFHYAPILTDAPLVRWRKDKVQAALAKPDASYATDEVRAAVELFTERLEDPSQQIRRVIPEDGMIIVNNHVALHGRTSFTDPARHLFRIRFHQLADAG